MSDRGAPPRSALRRISFTLILAAVVTDRVALYAWGYSVIRLYRTFDASLHNPKATRIEDLRPPSFTLDKAKGGSCRLDLLMYGSRVLPDGVSVYPDGVGSADSCTLKLLFLPPRLAWSTRLFPSGHFQGTSVLYYGYELTFTDGGRSGRAEFRLYRAVYSERKAVAPDSRWPHFY
jgi:hypothetical protein